MSSTQPGERRAVLYRAHKIYTSYLPSYVESGPFPDSSADRGGWAWKLWTTNIDRLYSVLMRFILMFAVLLGMVDSASAQTHSPLTIPRVAGPVTLDGMSTEAAWDSVAPWIPVQYEPNNGMPATERTEFLVAYDDEYVYLALRAFDSDPDGLRANTLYRDRLSGDDHFEILLDTFNDDETALLFTTTPAGIRKDAAISNDASGGGISSGGWINGDFNTYWDVATTTNAEGWFAEIRVPISSLRFQNKEGAVVMGIALQRKVARKTERLVFPPVPPVADWAFLKPSLAQKIEFEGIKSERPLYVTAYGLGGTESRPNAVQDTRTNSWRGGLDLKYGLTNNVTADLTFNTDFAQVEADDQQVNLTRFSLFYPEKRQFFQERSGLFDFRVGSQSRLFHSRRIGLDEAGQPVRIWGGGRMVGRIGGWDFGLLGLQTGVSDTRSSENFGVLRLRRQMRDGLSRLGGMLTSRLGRNGNYNLAFGLDGIVHLKGEDFLIYQWSQSIDHEAQDVDIFDATRFAISAERRRRHGWGYTSIAEWAGPAYDPGMGFTQRINYFLLDNTMSYTWVKGSDSPLIWHRPGLRGFAYFSPSLEIETAEIGPEWDFAAKSGAGGGVEFKIQTELLKAPFALSDKVQIPAGRYNFFRVGAEYNVSHTRLFQVRPHVQTGAFYDGWQVAVGAAPVWYVSKHLELSGSYQLTRIHFPSRNDTFLAHLGRLRIGSALNAKFSANVFIQFNSIQHVVSGNMRMRYNFREGNDLWVVYNQNLDTDRDRVLPRLPAIEGHTVLVKYTHTFRY
ncbi:MAG: carbohydrate binding family 9 domain-containing protein [Rhodothermaceae bacterium]|nr:carbohydrate binding family 9 domain-containing protein [Rhodothermaceae bacterium]